MEEKQTVSFENAMLRLEQIVGILENGQCSLDDSMKLFEEGAGLSALCAKQLQDAEQKIIQLSAVGNNEE